MVRGSVFMSEYSISKSYHKSRILSWVARRQLRCKFMSLTSLRPRFPKEIGSQNMQVGIPPATKIGLTAVSELNRRLRITGL